MSKPITKRWIFWVAVGLSVVSLGAVIFGVLTHTEAGLLPSVEEGARWSKEKFPLKVEAVSYRSDKVQNMTDDHKTAVDSVIKTINRRLGFEAYAWNKTTGEAQVDIVIGVPYEEDFVDQGGHFELRGAGMVFTTCSVSTTNTGSQEILEYTLEHELAHCLGLAHDESNMSIMRPVQKSRGTGFPPQITDHDRKLLREMYAP